MSLRVLLKLSGESLMGEREYGIDPDRVSMIVEQIAGARRHEKSLEVAVVVGAGNFFRGAQGVAAGMDRTNADYLGMLFTMPNAVALQDALEKVGVATRILSALKMNQLAEPYIRRRAIRHLEKRRVVIFACGSGNPYFTTDSAAALRAAEINASILLMAKNGVKGVYSDDPATNPDATFFERLTHLEAIEKQLKVMDSTALTLCMDNGLPIRVFNMDMADYVRQALTGMEVGTLIRSSDPAALATAAAAT